MRNSMTRKRVACDALQVISAAIPTLPTVSIPALSNISTLLLSQEDIKPGSAGRIVREF
jgi:hypothetical protein